MLIPDYLIKSFFLAVFGTLLLVSCEKRDPTYYALSDEANAWLPDQDGQVLTFGAAGATQTVRVTRWRELDEYTGKSFSVRSVTEWNFLVYQRALARDTGFSLAARSQQVAVLNTPAPSQYANGRGPLLGTLHTGANPVLLPGQHGQRVKLAFNQPLAGRTYPALATLDVAGVDSAATTGTNRLQRLYLAKDHGLVAFRTANGQLWLRQ